jgi:type I restriction enzyme, S subunit
MKAEWTKSKISDFVEITMGQSPKSEYYNFDGVGMPFLQGNRTFGRIKPTFDTWCSKPIRVAKNNSVRFMSVMSTCW